MELQTELNFKLSQIFSEVMEKFAFMFTDPTTKEDLSDKVNNFSSDIIMAEMNFKGNIKGTLSIALPIYMALEIGINALGIEADQDAEKSCAQDALKELINVLCGQVVILLAGREPVFDLSIPETHIITKNKWTELLKDKLSIPFIVEEYPVLFKLEILS